MLVFHLGYHPRTQEDLVPKVGQKAGCKEATKEEAPSLEKPGFGAKWWPDFGEILVTGFRARKAASLELPLTKLAGCW